MCENANGNLAWLLATCPDPKFRNGEKALENATKACELTAFKQSSKLESLAAAYAEIGNFNDAINTQVRAIELALNAKKKPEMEERLALYRSNKPYRSRLER